MRIVHIADIHVSSIYYNEEWGNNVVELIKKLTPTIVVISGDLTMEGYYYEFEIARDYIERIECEHKLIVPGNHDAKNVGYKSFERFFGSRFPSFEKEGVFIQGVDSSEPDIDDGHVGRENYGIVSNMKGNYKVLVLHHHLIPVPNTGRERNILVDAGDLLEVIKNSGVDLVLSGHRHVNWLWNLDGILFLTAGTATTRRLKGPDEPSFNVIDIDKEISIKKISSISGKENLLLKKRR